MPNDRQALEKLNIEIGECETRGDKKRLTEILAPRLAFLRADGKTFNDLNEFLAKVAPSGKRVTRIESTTFFGDRAIVTCIVTLTTDEGDKQFHNLRLFVYHKKKWRLLGWANEPRSDGQASTR